MVEEDEKANDEEDKMRRRRMRTRKIRMKMTTKLTMRMIDDDR